MTKPAAKLGDPGTDHDGFPPTPIVSGSPDVWIDGLPAARVGDPLAPHAKPKHPPHPRQIASGSTTVLVNGKPMAITGSAVDCGGVIIGSGSVVVGDQFPAGKSVEPPLITPWFDTAVRLLGSTGQPLRNFTFTYMDAGGNTHLATTGPDGIATGLAKAQKAQTITIDNHLKDWLAKGK